MPYSRSLRVFALLCAFGLAAICHAEGEEDMRCGNLLISTTRSEITKLDGSKRKLTQREIIGHIRDELNEAFVAGGISLSVLAVMSKDTQAPGQSRTYLIAELERVRRALRSSQKEMKGIDRALQILYFNDAKGTADLELKTNLRALVKELAAKRNLVTNREDFPQPMAWPVVVPAKEPAPAGKTTPDIAKPPVSAFENFLGPFESFLRLAHAQRDLPPGFLESLATAQDPLQIPVTRSDSTLIHLRDLIRKLDGRLARKYSRPELLSAVRARLDWLVKDLSRQAGGTVSAQLDSRELSLRRKVPRVRVRGAFALHPDGAHFIANHSLYDLRTGAKVRTYDTDLATYGGHVEITPDGKSVILGSDDPAGYSLVFDVETGKQRPVSFPFAVPSFPSWALSPSGDRLAGWVPSGKDGWEETAYALVHLNFPSLTAAPALPTRGKREAGDGQWPKDKGYRRFDAPAGRRTVYSKDGAYLAVERHRGIDVWGNDQKTFLGTLPLPESTVLDMAVDSRPPGRVLALCSDGDFYRWNIADGKSANPTRVARVRHFSPPHTAPVARFTPDGRYLVSLVEYGFAVAIIDTATGRTVYRSRKNPEIAFQDLAMSPDGKQFAVREGGGSLEIFSLERIIEARVGSPAEEDDE